MYRMSMLDVVTIEILYASWICTLVTPLLGSVRVLFDFLPAIGVAELR